MALIVLACPNIQSIDIELCDVFDCALLPLALIAPGGPALSEITLHRQGRQDDWTYRGGVGALAKMFERRKSIRVLKVTNDNLKQFAISTYNGPSEQSTTWPGISSIALQDCKLTPRAMATLLRICPNLTSLEMKSATGAELRYLADYGRLLRENARGLQRLVIDTGDNWMGNREELQHRLRQGGNIRGVGSLRDLIKLTELEATPWTLIFDPETEDGLHFVDILPWSLQTLTILPCTTQELMIDVEKEMWLLGQNSAFVNLTIHTQKQG